MADQRPESQADFLIAVCALLTRDVRLITRLIKNKDWSQPTTEAQVFIGLGAGSGSTQQVENKVSYESIATSGISSKDVTKAWSVLTLASVTFQKPLGPDQR